MRRFCCYLLCLSWITILPLWAHEFPDAGKSSASRCDSLSLQPYFRVKGKYPESSSSLARRASAALAAQGAFVGAEGYVCFQFLIDDKGKLKLLQSLETDAKFERNKFPPLLLSTLEQFLKSLDQWNPGHYKEKPLCYTGYMSFKIEDGHVAQVSP